jgi:UDP-2,3-diacylglucosamine hydrolase
MAQALFISDLHLSGARPEANERFAGFLQEQARGASALYILGDLFDYWLGDDALADASDPLARDVADGLSALSTSGTEVLVMHGNRDFLLGNAFCEAAGARLIEDPQVLGIAGEPTLLLHGDTLCTDDADYQAWRRTARSASWQREFLAQPLPARRQTMAGLREKSRQAVKAKPAAIMDVNSSTVEDAFRRHGVRRMIHGHTHRPAHHDHVVDGNPCERWVLPDWYETGGYLAADALGLRLQTF